MKAYNLLLKVRINGEFKFLKYRKVTKPVSLFQYLESKGYTIDFVNVYNSATKEPIKSFPYTGTFNL